MEVILKKDIQKLGNAGDVITVKAGYARNFLFPHELALCASVENLNVVEQEKKRIALCKEKEKKQAEDLARKISVISCTISVQTGEDGKLFGSVTNQDIAQAYKAEGVDIDKRKIDIPEPIKEAGVFKVDVKLHPEVTVQAKIWVVKK